MGEIRKNQKVNLTFHMIDGSEKNLDCQIKKVYADRLALTAPDEILEFADYLSEGEEIVAKIFTPAGIKIFDSIVLDSPNEPEFVIEFPEIASELQRREYARVQLEAKIVIQREDRENLVTYTIDISGGGVRFSYNGEFWPKEKVAITLYLPDLKFIQAKGHIVQNDFLPKNVHVLTFDEINEMDRDRIVKKCFEIQTKKLEFEYMNGIEEN